MISLKRLVKIKFLFLDHKKAILLIINLDLKSSFKAKKNKYIMI